MSFISSKGLIVAGLMALLSCTSVAAQTVNLGNETCTQNYTRTDYYDNGKFNHSYWQPSGMTCFANGGSYNYGDPDGSGGEGEPIGADTSATVAACRSGDPVAAATHLKQEASKTGRDINAKPDSNNNEYLAVVYRDASGALRSSPLIAGGSSVSATPAALGTTWSNIVGIIHNHPSARYCPDPISCQINRNPSSSATVPTGQQSDWDTAELAVANGANPTLLTLYVVGPDRVLRQFAYQNRSSYLPYRSGGVLVVTEGPTVPLNLTPTTCP